jgi:hypothetical protein
MGHVSPLLRPVPQGILNEIEALFDAAKMSGVAIIDASGEAVRLLKAVPECRMTKAEIADAITQEGVRHSGIGIIFGGPA